MELVSKLDIGLFALAGLAVFLIIRGAGQKIDAIGETFSDPTGIKSVGGGITDFFSNLSLPSLPSFGSVSAESVDPNAGVFVGIPEVGTPSLDLIPTAEETEIGNRSILDKIFGGAQMAFADIPQTIAQSIPNAQLNLGGFQGEATEAPIGALSLGRIIERFGVTASQAADIRARGGDDFDNFDFGTNTGSGIGNAIQGITELLPNLGTVSNPEFTGLSATEIARRLTGGNINNF